MTRHRPPRAGGRPRRRSSRRSPRRTRPVPWPRRRAGRGVNARVRPRHHSTHAPEPQADHRQAQADHDPEGPEDDGHRRPVGGGEGLQALAPSALASPAVIRLPSLGIESSKRLACDRRGRARRRCGRPGRTWSPRRPRWRRAWPAGSCSDLLAGHVADQQLQRRDDGEHADGHAQGDPRFGLVGSLQQRARPRPRRPPGRWSDRPPAPCGRAAREGRREDHLHPVGGDAAGRPPPTAKPAGCCIQLLAEMIQKAEIRVPKATRQVAAKCRPRPDLLPAEQHHAQEARLEEEGGQHLEGQQRADHRRGRGREDAPVGAELVAHAPRRRRRPCRRRWRRS